MGKPAMSIFRSVGIAWNKKRMKKPSSIWKREFSLTEKDLKGSPTQI